MKILRYTPELQKALNSKTKSEPWLHCGLKPDGSFVVYIWDTRQVLEEGQVKHVDKIKSVAKPAKDDNKQPLKGAKGEWKFKIVGKRNIESGYANLSKSEAKAEYDRLIKVSRLPYGTAKEYRIIDNKIAYLQQKFDL